MTSEADRTRLARVGTPDEDEPIWQWSHEGYGQTCRACGAAHEGTAGATIDHWKECVGICAYAQAVRFGVDKATAVLIALEVQRTSGMPPTLARAREALSSFTIPASFGDLVDEALDPFQVTAAINLERGNFGERR